jgi:hypothetical protein
MIDFNSLEDMVKRYATLFKNNYKFMDSRPTFKTDVEYHDTYLAGVAFRDRVVIHAEPDGKFPERIFAEKAPNQTKKEYDYIKGNYKQNTLPVYIDFQSTVSRAWSDGNWDISFKDEKDNVEDSLQYYLETEINLFGSIENYWKQLITHMRNVDPNAVVAVRPEALEMIVDEAGNFVIDSSKRVRPQPYFYRCDQVLFRDEKLGYLILTDEKCDVEYAGKIQKIGLVLEFYDDTTVYRIMQTGKLIDWNFTTEIFFVHGEGVIPVTTLKAIPKLIGRKLVYMPEFLYACDNLDLALMNAQYLQCSISLVNFPYRVMVGGECTYAEKDDSNGQYNNCVDGWITRIYEDRQSRHQCPACFGSGLKDRVSQVGGVLLLSKEDWSGSGDKSFADKAMYYVSPNTENLEFTKVKILEDLEAARRIMHLQTSTTEVKANSSGTATGQMMDERAKDAFVKPISDNLFSSLEFTIDRIGWQRYGAAYEAPVIIYPNTFGYNTEQDYLKQLTEARAAGMPSFLIYTIFLKFLKTLYFHEQETTDIFRLIISADRILTMSNDEANLRLSKGLIEKWEVVLHDSAINFVNELRVEAPNLFDLDLQEQITKLKDKAKALSDSIKSESQTNQQNIITEIIG